jgi:predicted nucleic acid-binding protein
MTSAATSCCAWPTTGAPFYCTNLFLEMQVARSRLLRRVEEDQVWTALERWYGATPAAAQRALLPETRRLTLLGALDGLVEDVLGLFDTYEVRLTAGLIRDAQVWVAAHQLTPSDALLLTIAARESPHLASVDSDFLKVEDCLQVWNNRIPERRRSGSRP